jgi:hypothetical protein
MSKPYSEADLSTILDDDLIWRRREFSDMKGAIKAADARARAALLRALVMITYAHWEGYVRGCANRYFEFLTLRKSPFSRFERQIYVNSVLSRLDGLHRARSSIEARCALINDILDGIDKRFSRINPDLIDTKSNLNTDVMEDICRICGVDSRYFADHRTFIDVILLRRRNAIAHGQQEFIDIDELDEFVSRVLDLMGAFRNLIENKIYTKSYAA